MDDTSNPREESPKAYIKRGTTATRRYYHASRRSEQCLDRLWERLQASCGRQVSASLIIRRALEVFDQRLAGLKPDGEEMVDEIAGLIRNAY